MADDKKELSKEEIEAIKKVEEAVKPIIKDEDKKEITNLIDEIEDNSKEKSLDIKESISDTKESIEEEVKEAKEEAKELVQETKDNLEDKAKEEIEDAKESAKELGDEVKEKIEDEAKELKDTLEDETKEKIEEVKESEEIKEEAKKVVQEEIKPKGAKNKNLIAKKKIEEVRESVKEVEKEVQEAIKEVKAKIEDFEEYEANVLNRVIATAKERLKDIGFEEKEIELPTPKAEIDTKDKPISINDISTGAGGAFVTGLLGAIATVAGWCIYASKVQGVPFPPQKLPNAAELSTKASTIANSLGMGENATAGGAVVVGSALVVFFIIYKVMVSMRASKNLEISKKIEADAKEYSQKQLEFKEMVQKIGQHVDELKSTTEDFEVLLDEKNASLRRAKAFEKVESFDELNPKTKETAKDTDELVTELQELLAAPMAKDAILNQESIDALNRAKELVSNQVEKIYK